MRWRSLSFLLAAAAITACGDSSYERVSMKPSGVGSLARVENPLIVGMAPIISAKASSEGLHHLAEWLARDLGRPVHPYRGRNYQEINDLLILGQVQVGIVCTGAVQDPRILAECEVLAAPLIGGRSEYHSLVLVREGDPARRFEDLKGRSIAVTDPLSLSGYYYPVSRARDLGSPFSSFFGKIQFTYSHDLSIHHLLRGIVDCAAVDSLVYHALRDGNPATARELRILETSPPFPSSPVLVPRSLDAGLKAKIWDSLSRMERSQNGGEVMDEMGWDGLARPTAEYLKLLTALRAKVAGVTGRDKRPA